MSEIEALRAEIEQLNREKLVLEHEIHSLEMELNECENDRDSDSDLEIELHGLKTDMKDMVNKADAVEIPARLRGLAWVRDAVIEFMEGLR